MSIFWHVTCLLLLRSCTPGFFIHGIVGGKVSVPHSRPYMVYIREKFTKNACGGFLVREDYVLTAAHCKQHNLMVYLGVDDTGYLPDGVEVEPFPHPRFNMRRTGHDIMLLKLKTPATLSKTVSTITLPKPENEEISKDCMVMGWGWRKYHQESPSNVLKEAIVTLIDSENCDVADTLCSEGSTGPAQGDSGGPLVCGGVAQGIVSFSKDKGNAGHFTGYTHISHYFSWIHDNMMSSEIPKMLDQVSRPGTLVATSRHRTTKPDKPQVLSVSISHSRPYMVYIRDKVSKQACRGFLVREDFVMTAAHCMQRNLMAYLGVDDINFLPAGVEVDPFPHPRFNMRRTGHDIMLLKLKTPATLSKTVSTITFPKTENEAISKDCMVMGWGWKKHHHESPSNVLKAAIVTLIDSENCGMADTLCSEGSTGPAQGDGGGPLVCGGVAQGIVSFFKNKGNADYLTLYTHISHYLPWIHHIMSPGMPKILDQVSTPGTLDPTPGRWTPKPDKQEVLSAGGKAPHSRPYMVYIRGKVSKEACGGFLVREDYVMTAAHCKQSHLMVYLGVDDTNRLPDGVEVDPHPHPKFTMKRNGHDIMLLKLKAPATLNKSVNTVTFPKTENEAISKDCMVMGWQKYHHESSSNVLKAANVTLIDSENCGVADTLCSEGSTGPAQGHSGGPLVCGGVAQGIVSFSKNKGNADYLTVYTHISHYLPWIHHIMSPDMPKILDQVSTPGTLDPTPADAKYQNPSAVFCLVPKTQ